MKTHIDPVSVRRQIMADWQYEIGSWSCETFPESTQDSVIEHIKDEVNKELVPDCDQKELADVVILILGLAHRRKINLFDAIIEKFKINRKRKWGPKNSRGFQEHLPEPRND